MSSDKEILALEDKPLATFYQYREYVAAGGLISYGASLTIPIVKPVSIPGESSRARSRPTCPFCSRPSSSWSSISRQQTPSDLQFRAGLDGKP